MNIRELQREEIEEIWTIDRGEVIENIYYLQNGNLVLQPEHYDMQGWPPGEPEQYIPILIDCFDRGRYVLWRFSKRGADRGGSFR